MKPKHTLILLPTDKESELFLTPSNALLTKNNWMHDNLDKNQILIIVSDDRIKPDDWYYHGVHKTILQEKPYLYATKDCKKIIASTNKSLNLPWIDISKCQWIITYYNENKIFPKIELEVE